MIKRTAFTALTLPGCPAWLDCLLRWLLRLACAGSAVGAAGIAQAQVLDDVEYRRQGADAVLAVRFITGVQYLRSVSSRSGDQTSFFYRVLPTRQTLTLDTSERRLPARGGLPAVIVTDEAAIGRTANERRVLVRFASAVRHRVRAGSGNRNIELVLDGLGPQVLPLPLAAQQQPVAAPPLAAAAAAAAAAPATAASAASSAAPAAAPGPEAGPAAVEDFGPRAAALLVTAREALARDDTAAAIQALSALLDLPPTPSTREAQALIGQARLKAGDTGRARAEFDHFLRLYPTGEDAERVRREVAALSGPGAPALAPDGSVDRRPASTTTLTGSVSSTYYGGQSKIRTQEFQDSPLSGLPELISEATLSDTDQKQLVSSADVNWRHRDAEVDQRFVFRDTYSQDRLRPEKTYNRLSALYFDQRSYANGTSFRVGRQSPLGGGVLGRFDGVQAGYAFRPRWKASVVAGVPTDELLDTRRYFYGAAVEAEAITPHLGGSLYGIEQKIDGVVDRRALGTELRYFDGGLSGTAQLDYDLVLKGMNIVSLQGTWQRPDNTVVNLMFDRRKTPMLMLGNTLFFTGSVTPGATRVSDLLGTGGYTLQSLRELARNTAAMSTQASLGLTTPLTPQWQVGGDLRYTSTGALEPVPDILPQGQPATGDIWSLGLQLIGTNLYSARDTHVLIANFINGPAFQGQLLSYNNASSLGPAWQLEPSLKLYRQTSSGSVRSSRWSPGLRLTWRARQQLALETEVNVENSKTTSPSRNESSTRTFYYLGARYDF